MKKEHYKDKFIERDVLQRKTINGLKNIWEDLKKLLAVGAKLFID